MPYSREEITNSNGKRLAYADTLAGTYTPIFGTVEVNTPEREWATEEITSDDTPDKQKDYIVSLCDPGTMSFTYRYGKTQFAAVEAVFQSAATKFWKYTLPDGSFTTWRGFLTKHDLPSDGVEGALTVEAEMQVISKVTFTAAA